MATLSVFCFSSAGKCCSDTTSLTTIYISPHVFRIVTMVGDPDPFVVETGPAAEGDVAR